MGGIQDLGTIYKKVANLTGEFVFVIRLEKQGKVIGLLHDMGKVSSKSEVHIRSTMGLIKDEDDYVNFAKMKGKMPALVQKFYTNIFLTRAM